MAELDESINRCQKVLGGIIDDPSLLASKSLIKPSFRLIHAIVLSVLGVTGFPTNYFSSDELDPSFPTKVDDKEQKLAFLRKLIRLVQTSREGLSSANELLPSVRASRIVSGREPHKTNILLAEFGLAATDESLHRDRVSRTCLLEHKSAEAAMKKDNTVSVDPDAAQSSMPHHENGVVGVGNSTGHGHSKKNNDIESWPKTSTALKTSIEECDGTIDKTVKALKDILPEEKHALLNEDALKRPSLRFLHDIILSLCKRTGYCDDESGNGTFTIGEFDFSNLVDKPTKQAFFQKIIHEVQTTLHMTLLVRSSKVISGKECDETRKFLQLLAVAAKQDGTNKEWMNASTADESKIISAGSVSSATDEKHQKENSSALEKGAEQNANGSDRQISKSQPAAVNDQKANHSIAAPETVNERSSVREEVLTDVKSPDVKASKINANKDPTMSKKTSLPASNKKDQSNKRKNGEIRIKFSLDSSRFGNTSGSRNKVKESTVEDLSKQLFEKQDITDTIRQVIERVQYLRSFEEDIEDDISQLAIEKDYWKKEYEMQLRRMKDEIE